MCICLSIEICPSHTTNAEPISPLVTSVEAPYYTLNPPLPASETLSSSWSLAVICTLIARGKFKPELEFQAGISCSYHALYKCENIGYVEVPEYQLSNTRTQNSERSDEISPYLMVACVQVPGRKLLVVVVLLLL